MPGLYAPYGSLEQQHELALEQEYLLQRASASKQGGDSKDRRRRDAREEAEARAIASQAAKDEFDRRRPGGQYEEFKEQPSQQTHSLSVSARSSTSRSASARTLSRSPSASSSSRRARSGERDGGSHHGTLELSLTGAGLTVSHPSYDSRGGRREVAFHSSDRATDSQRDVRATLKIRAESAKAKEAAVKARADAARAKVREQMKRNKEVEKERRRDALKELDDSR